MCRRTLHLVFTLTRGNFIAHLICISFSKRKNNAKTNKEPSFISVFCTNSDLNLVRSEFMCLFYLRKKKIQFALVKDITEYCRKREMPVYSIHSLQQFGRKF